MCRWPALLSVFVPASHAGRWWLHIYLAHVAQIVLASGGTVVHADPQLQRLHERLNEMNRKIMAGELDIPPEHERSPSPEPVYDANGVRLNTREIRCVCRLVVQLQGRVADAGLQRAEEVWQLEVDCMEVWQRQQQRQRSWTMAVSLWTQDWSKANSVSCNRHVLRLLCYVVWFVSWCAGPVRSLLSGATG